MSTESAVKSTVFRFCCKPMVFFFAWIILSTVLPNYVSFSEVQDKIGSYGLSDQDGYFAMGSHYELNYDVVTATSGLINSEIILVMAHPDDESMFFGPTLIELSKKNYNNNIHVICLSNGDFDNIGYIRVQEISRSAKILDFTSVKVLEYEDNIHKSWDFGLIKDTLLDELRNMNFNDSSKENLVFLTFDDEGVSGHPNHISLNGGVWELVNNLDSTSLGPDHFFKKVRYWNLKSWNVLHKYSFQIVTNFEIIARWLLKSRDIGSELKFYLKVLTEEYPSGVAQHLHDRVHEYIDTQPVSIKIHSDLGMWFLNMSCMAFAHYSQIVWFRWFWLIFSKYLNTNELVLAFSGSL